MATKRKKTKPILDGWAVRNQVRTFNLLFEKIADGWKGSTTKIRTPVYVYKLDITTSVNDPHNRGILDSNPTDESFQGFCLQTEIDNFLERGIFTHRDSVFSAVTPAMEKRILQNVARAYYDLDTGRYSCKRPFDALKRGIASARFWGRKEFRYCLYSLDGKVIAIES